MSSNFPGNADIAAGQKDHVFMEPLLWNNVLRHFPHLSLAPLMGRGVIYPVFGSRNQEGRDDPLPIWSLLLDLLVGLMGSGHLSPRSRGCSLWSRAVVVQFCRCLKFWGEIQG